MSHLFIEYANANLTQGPEELKKIIDALMEEFGPIHAVPDLPSLMEWHGPLLHEITLPTILTRIIENITAFGSNLMEACIARGKVRTPPHIRIKLKNSHEADSLKLRGNSAITNVQLAEFSRDLNIDSTAEIAFEAAFGHVDGCRDQDGASRCPILSPWIYNTPLDGEAPTCYECHQAGVKRILQEITNGQELETIQGLPEILHLGVSSYRRAVNITDCIDIRNGWKSPLDHEGHFLPGPDSEFPFKFIFNNLLMSFVGYSLGKFLSDKKLSRTRLHKCEICGDFFVDEPRSKRCPPPKDCRKAGKHSYQMEYMRNKRNPESEKFDEKYIK
jgi:hypothetical protein